MEIIFKNPLPTADKTRQFSIAKIALCSEKHTQSIDTLKSVAIHATKALGGEEVYLLLILDLGTGWGSVVNVTPWPGAPGKGPPVPIVQEAG
jgi:hypothetical protein